MRKILGILLCTILIVSTIAIIFSTAGNSLESRADPSLYTAHDPIYIDGNTDFTAENGVTGGTGIQSDPYIIEGWDINASSADGIEIRNTDAYFIIRNCYVHDGCKSYDGIYFYNVQNGRIENTISSNNSYGIYLGSSSDNTVSSNSANSNNFYGIYMGSSSDNTVSSNSANSNKNCGISLGYSSNNNDIHNNSASYNWCGIEVRSSSNNGIFNNSANSNNWCGIFLDYSSNNTVSNNIASNNKYGIRLYSSTYNTLRKNTFEKDGIFIEGDRIEHFNTHKIDTTNTANSKPIYYYANQKDINIDGWSAGQVILANCTNSVIKNIDCSNASIGVQLAYCNHCSIENSMFNNEIHGICLECSSHINIYNSDANSNNNFGFYLWNSSNNAILNNNASNNCCGILLLDNSNNNTVVINNASNNYCGISLGSSSYNTFLYNDIHYNNYSVELYKSFSHSCENNTFHHNNFINGSVIKVTDNGANTKWDDGYGEGNYWSNYDGMDDGFNGRIADDGIGDTNIPHMGLDNYPLMEPFTPPPTTEEPGGSLLNYWWFILFVIIIVIIIVIVTISKRWKGKFEN